MFAREIPRSGGENAVHRDDATKQAELETECHNHKFLWAVFRGWRILLLNFRSLHRPQ